MGFGVDALGDFECGLLRVLAEEVGWELVGKG